ncbi:MAG: universal stress protein [Nitrospirae bacterium]|nr:universal stress protein [Nitrospirota bacterium]
MQVLLAVDGSKHSNDAAEAIRGLASIKSLTVLHVLDLPRLSYPMLGPDIAQDLAMIVEQAMREEGANVLKRTMSHLSYHATPINKRLEEGAPSELILSVAQDMEADLIILGARGVGQIQELVLGSVSHRVLGHAHCPVFLVNGELREMKNVLLPIQDDQDVERAKHFLTKRPFHGEAHITVFSVVPIPRSIFRAGVSASEGKIQQALESAEHHLDQAVNTLHGCPYSVTGLVGMGAPAETIVNQALEMKPDLIMMGLHHPSAMTRMVFGTVSHTVLHRSPRPILLIR